MVIETRLLVDRSDQLQFAPTPMKTFCVDDAKRSERLTEQIVMGVK
jgi:hypothetical protein